jgi:hypothetical protein
MDSTQVDGAMCFIDALLEPNLNFSVPKPCLVIAHGGLNTAHLNQSHNQLLNVSIHATMVDNAPVLEVF